MKISTKGRYALRLMLDLALNNTGEAVSLKDIARRQDISDKYLEQIISILNKAGYVRSIRGAQGGYMLRRPPKEYTVGMILRLTEGTLAPVSCVEDDAVECEREASCVTFIVWKKINDAINEVVDNITLEDLVSTGGSSLKAVEAIRNNGCEVIGMVASYTYGFPVAEEAFAKAGVELVTLTDYDHVVKHALAIGYIKPEDVEVIHEWRKDPANWNNR